MNTDQLRKIRIMDAFRVFQRWSPLDPGTPVDEVITGRCSYFGGLGDPGMTPEEGLAYYEHHEADKRPDLFLPRSTDTSQGTSQRLRPDAYYCALRLPTGKGRRSLYQGSFWRIENSKTKQFVVCQLVDWGPNVKTGRVVDLSLAAMRALKIGTDHVVSVSRIT